ncbi:MAG: Beta-barrel assembly machine subunit BamD [Ignavibacteria bacterium]|nr:Beta-barrel assembly machine subunit BamD [Ignavibacteria bacterium]
MIQKKAENIFLKNLRKLASLLILVTLISCGSTKKDDSGGVETVFKSAMEKFKSKDWLEATKLFDIIKLQYPASQFADDAQYYLAEINYERGEYILAAFNYNSLRRSYPSSEYVRVALFKAAKSYYELSPSFDRDQEYTFKAITIFSEFQSLYPKDSLYPSAVSCISELRDKLGQREYSIAFLYEKLKDPKAAMIYFDVVINDYPDSKFFEDAVFGKIKMLSLLNRYDEAKGLIELYKKNFPSGRFLNEISLVNISVKAK